MTTSWIVAASGFFSVVAAFWLGTFNNILSSMSTNIYAAAFVYSVALLIFVGLYNIARGRNIATGMYSKRNQFTFLALILIVTVGLQPYLIQGVYSPSDMTLYGGVDYTISNHTTSYFYYNTTTNWISSTAVETAVGTEPSGEWSFPMPTDAVQDMDKRAGIQFFWTSYSNVDNFINSTALDQDTTDHIIALSVKVTMKDSDAGKVVRFQFGFETKTDLILTTYTIGTEKMITLPSSFFTYVDEYQSILADDHVVVILDEQDADCMKMDGRTVDVEIHFFADTATTDFNNYLFGAAAINFLVALGMTASWNPMRHFNNSSFRPRKWIYRRPRWSRRRYYHRPRFRRPRWSRRSYYRRPRWNRRNFYRRRRY